MIEAGSWRGGASMLMRATLDSLGERERTVWVADSFQGFPRGRDDRATATTSRPTSPAATSWPSRWRRSRPASPASASTRASPSSRASSRTRCPTLPARRWAIVRLDGDSYEATRLALEALYPNLAGGGYLIVDDYLAARRVPAGRRRLPPRATGSPSRSSTSTGAACGGGVRASPPRCPRRAPRPVGRRRIRAGRERWSAGPRERVPAIEEVALRHEVAELRARLEAAEREIEAAESHPLRAARAWARRHGFDAGGGAQLDRLRLGDHRSRRVPAVRRGRDRARRRARLA